MNTDSEGQSERQANLGGRFFEGMHESQRG
jgi:hypothetical protein